VQLYNLKDDPAERNNLQAKHPEIVKDLAAQLATAIHNGRTTPGPKQSNEGWPDTFNARVLAEFPELKGK
jgi:hypothetical protein